MQPQLCHLVYPQLSVSVDHFGAVPAAVEEGSVLVVAFHMVKNIPLQFGHLATQDTLPLLHLPVHDHGHVHQEHVVPLLWGRVCLSSTC